MPYPYGYRRSPTPRVTIEGESAALIQRMRRAGDIFQQRNQTRYAATIRDMADRVGQYGDWASVRQRDYAMSLLAIAERGVTTVAATSLNVNVTAGADAAASTPIFIAPVRNDRLDISPAALARIRALFAAAQQHGIQRPKINVRISTSLTLVLKPCTFGPNAGWIYVKHGDRGRMYAGKISQTGIFIASASCPDEVFRGLQMFGDDPLGIARAHGHATGNCCFCRRHLSDARSVAMGYGPVCAENYGLEWGEQRAPSVVQMADAARSSEGTVPVQPPMLTPGMVADAREAMRRTANVTAGRPFLRQRGRGRSFLEARRRLAAAQNRPEGDLRPRSVGNVTGGMRGQGDVQPRGQAAPAPDDEDKLFE